MRWTWWLPVLIVLCTAVGSRAAEIGWQEAVARLAQERTHWPRHAPRCSRKTVTKAPKAVVP
jgi:hypothetical protein